MKQLLIAIDQTVNTLIPLPRDGGGMADETLSARLFRCHLQGRLPARWYRAVDALFWWEPHHCHASWRAEFERRQLPGHYRNGSDDGGGAGCQPTAKGTWAGDGETDRNS